MDFTYFFWNSKTFLELEEQGTKLGFDLYDPGHLIWLAAIAAATALISTLYCGRWRAGRGRRRKIRKIFAVVIVLSEVYRDSVLAVTGYFTAEYLPLHLCSFAIFTIFIDAFAEGQKVTRQLLAYAFMPGAMSALLFCNWTEYPYLNFMNIHSFFIHGWIVCYVVMRLRAGEIRPDYRGMWKTVLMILLLTPPLFWFNSRFGTNFMFLNEASEGSPLVPVWDLLGTRFGYPGYLTGCAVLIIAVFHVLWMVYFLMQRGTDNRETKVE